MNIVNFQFEQFEPFSDKLKEVQSNLEPDLILFFAPYTFFESKEFHVLHSAVRKTKCVAVSSVGTIKGSSLVYNSYGGIAVKFTKNGNILINTKENISKTVKESAIFLTNKVLKEKEGTNLIFSTSSNLAVHRILSISFKNIKNNLRIYGGVASSNASDFRTYISVDGKIIEDGFVIIKLQNVESFNTVSLGFIPVGTTYTVTKSKDDTIYFLDEFPVYYFLSNILRNTGISPEDLDPVKTSEVLWEFPFLFIDEDGYISHLLVPREFDNENQGLAFYGEVPQGSRLKLSTGDSEDILRDVRIKAGEFKEIIKHSNKKPELILNITCTARNYLLAADGLHDMEQKQYYEMLKEFPHSGFLTFGEIGPDKMGKPGKFFNETSILVGLVER